VAPDYFVRAIRRDQRDELIISVVSERSADEWPALKEAIEERLKDRLGVRIEAAVVVPGALDAWTEAGTSPKLKRFRDERHD
jgi:phenylacetate-coenzyme A ligase PaaK-like adenylate-forming protein